MNDDFPRSADSITNAWLSEVLGAPVTGFKTTYLEGGVLSDAFKLHDITYVAPASDAPCSVVVKLTQREEEQRNRALASNAYVKEVGFFRQLAAEMPIRTDSETT